jgi:hypothetical protein
MKIFKFLLIFSTIFIISCETFSGFYDQWQDTNALQNVITLREGEEPRISRSNNLDDDFFEILSNNFLCIGTTSFNGPDNNIVSDIKNQCIKNGATLAIYNKIYTDTRSGVYSSGNYVNSYNIRRYDYGVYYFVQRTLIPLFGWRLVDLDNNNRQNFHRNTGAIVYVVIKSSPAFYANIVKNDIIIRINDHIINNVDDYYNLLDSVIDFDDEFEVEFVRNNQNNIVKIKM